MIVLRAAVPGGSHNLCIVDMYNRKSTVENAASLETLTMLITYLGIWPHEVRTSSIIIIFTVVT